MSSILTKDERAIISYRRRHNEWKLNDKLVSGLASFEREAKSDTRYGLLTALLGVGIGSCLMFIVLSALHMIK